MPRTVWGMRNVHRLDTKTTNLLCQWSIVGDYRTARGVAPADALGQAVEHQRGDGGGLAQLGNGPRRRRKCRVEEQHHLCCRYLQMYIIGLVRQAGRLAKEDAPRPPATRTHTQRHDHKWHAKERKAWTCVPTYYYVPVTQLLCGSRRAARPPCPSRSLSCRGSWGTCVPLYH